MYYNLTWPLDTLDLAVDSFAHLVGFARLLAGDLGHSGSSLFAAETRGACVVIPL